MNKIILIIFCCFLSLLSFEAHSQHQLKIGTNLGNSFDSYILTIRDTNFTELAKYKFKNPDTTFYYTFEKVNPRKFVYVQLTGHIEKSIDFFTSKRVVLTLDSAYTIYNIGQITQQEIDDYKKMTNPTPRKKIKRESGIFNKASPWMWCVGYTYQKQKDQSINLEVRKTGTDISGDHGDGLYAMTLFYAPYIIWGGDATIYPSIQFAPKAGIGCYFVLANANLSFIAYNTDFNKFNPALVPEVGFSFPFGFLHIDYGYNLYLNNMSSFNKNNQKISIKASWYFDNKKVW
jgi:hypothetical protein